MGIGNETRVPIGIDANLSNRAGYQPGVYHGLHAHAISNEYRRWCHDRLHRFERQNLGCPTIQVTLRAVDEDDTLSIISKAELSSRELIEDDSTEDEPRTTMRTTLRKERFVLSQ